MWVTHNGKGRKVVTLRGKRRAAVKARSRSFRAMLRRLGAK